MTSPMFYLTRLVLLLAFFSQSAAATILSHTDGKRLLITDQQGEYLLGKHLLILEDASRTITLEELQNPRNSPRFFASSKEVPGFGFSSSAYWLKLEIDRRTTRESQWLLELGYAPMQWIDVYTITGDNVVHYPRGGSSVPFLQRALPYHKHLFELSLPPNQITTLFIRVDGENSKTIPLKLYRSDVFSRVSSKEIAVFSAYAGIVIALFLYNFFVYTAIREIVYVHYLFFLAAFLLFTLSFNGFMQEILSIESANLAIRLTPFSMGLVAVFGCRFAATFLSAKEKMGRYAHLINAIYAWGVLSTVLPWLTDYRTSIINSTILAIVFSVVLLSVSVIAVKQGNRAAKFYLLAWCLLLVGIFLTAARALGILPTNSLTEYGIVWGAACEAVLLSIALTARLRIMKETSERANEGIRIAQQEALKNKQIALETVEQYSAKLETEVAARTNELVATQQRLVATEKMAALGVFTAGMAHEINNPANFVSVGAQVAEVEVDRLKRFLDELLDDDGDQSIRDDFDTRFNKINGSIETIKTGAKRIENIVKALRANHPEGQTEMQYADVVDSLESAWRVLAPTLKIPVSIDMQLNARAGIACMIAEINQVFLALLGNAAHAIEDAMAIREQTYTGNIRLQSEEVDGRLKISITDNGIGIPADKIDKVFDPFFTTKPVGRGTGLGLSMAREVINRHDGSLDVTSVEGQGTTFVVTLPVATY